MGDYATEDDLFDLEGDDEAGSAYASADDLFEPGVVSDAAPAAAEPYSEPKMGAGESVSPYLPNNDVVMGLGNPLNIQQGLARLGNALGMLDDADAERLIRTIESDIAARRERGAGYGVGQTIGDAAVGTAAMLSGAGAVGAGAAMGGVGEYNRTGDAGDAVMGAAVGGAAGRAGELLAPIAGNAIGGAGRKVAQYGTDVLDELPGRALRNQIADRATKVARQVGLRELPPPRVAQGSLQEMLDAVPHEVARVAAKGTGAVSSAANRGALGPQGLSDALHIASQSLSPGKMGLAERGLRVATGYPIQGAGSAMSWAGRNAAGLVGGAATGLGASQADLLSPASAEAQFDYADAMPQVGPTDVSEDVYFSAFAEAYDDPALQSRNGLAGELAGMLTQWTQGEAPSPQAVALMAFKLSEVPGLQWASLDPARNEGSRDE